MSVSSPRPRGEVDCREAARRRGLKSADIQPPSHSLRESSPRGGALKKLSVRDLIRLAMLGTFPQGEGFKQLTVENSFLPKARKRAGGPPPSGREISDHFPLESIFTSTLGGGGAHACVRDGRSFKRAVVERLPKGETYPRTNRHGQAGPTESLDPVGAVRNGNKKRGGEKVPARNILSAMRPFFFNLCVLSRSSFPDVRVIPRARTPRDRRNTKRQRCFSLRGRSRRTRVRQPWSGCPEA